MTEALFDLDLLLRRRLRAAPEFARHDFLHRRAAEDIAARLAAVTRDFPLAVELGARGGALMDMVDHTGRIGAIVHAATHPAFIPQDARLRVTCDEECLPFADASLDLLLSNLALQAVNDLPGTLIQIRRALKPDGLLLASLFGGRTLFELREAMTAAESEIEGGASPHVSPFADVRDYGGLLQRAGFALPVTDADTVIVTYATPLDLMRELRGMGETNALNARSRRPMRRETLMRAVEIYAERFPAEGGRISATFEIVHLTGWAPAESQPKPLRPGSARTRLADALGTTEYSAGEKARPGRER